MLSSMLSSINQNLPKNKKFEFFFDKSINPRKRLERARAKSKINSIVKNRKKKAQSKMDSLPWKQNNDVAEELGSSD